MACLHLLEETMVFDIWDRISTETIGTAPLVIRRLPFVPRSTPDGGELFYAIAIPCGRFELGIGALEVGPDERIHPRTVLESSENGERLSLPPGDKEVFVTSPALFLDGVASAAPTSFWSSGEPPAGALWLDNSEHPEWHLKLRTSFCDITVISFSAQSGQRLRDHRH